MCIAEMLRNTRLQHRDSSVNIPLPPDQHHCSDEAKWRIGKLDRVTTNNRQKYQLRFVLSYDILVFLSVSSDSLFGLLDVNAIRQVEN